MLRAATSPRFCHELGPWNANHLLADFRAVASRDYRPGSFGRVNRSSTKAAGHPDRPTSGRQRDSCITRRVHDRGGVGEKKREARRERTKKKRKHATRDARRAEDNCVASTAKWERYLRAGKVKSRSCIKREMRPAAAVLLLFEVGKARYSRVTSRQRLGTQLKTCGQKYLDRWKVSGMGGWGLGGGEKDSLVTSERVRAWGGSGFVETAGSR